MGGAEQSEAVAASPVGPSLRGPTSGALGRRLPTGPGGRPSRLVAGPSRAVEVLLESPADRPSNRAPDLIRWGTGHPQGGPNRKRIQQ